MIPRPLLISFLYFAAGSFALATQPEIVLVPSDVKWSQGLLPGTVRVTITALALPEDQIVSNESIYLLTEKGEVLELDVAQHLRTATPLVADERGAFSLVYDLPPGHAQIPIQIERAGLKRLYSLQLRVERAETRHPYFQAKTKIIMGAGADYIIYEQRMGEISANFDYRTYSGPSYFVGLWRRWNPRWSTSLNYSSAPSSLVSAGDVTFSEGSYRWNNLSVEFERDAPWTAESLFRKAFHRVHWILGVQYSSLPLMARTDDSSGTEYTVKANDLLMLNGGLGATVLKNSNWIYEGLVRVSYPLQRGDFKYSPEFAFDGSLGAIYQPALSPWSYGVYWYGYWHEYGFEVSDAPSDSRLSGSDTQFFSSLEFRLCYGM